MSESKLAEDVADRLWAQSKDRSLYKDWASVPEEVKAIWRKSFRNIVDMLDRAGFVVVEKDCSPRDPLPPPRLEYDRGEEIRQQDRARVR